MAIPYNMKRDDLLAKLREMLPAAEKADAVTLKKHERDEAAHLKRFKEACREALKWDYETAKAHRFEAKVTKPNSYGGRSDVYAPHCPTARVDIINRAIAEVEMSTLQRFVITETGKYRSIYQILTAGLLPLKAVC